MAAKISINPKKVRLQAGETPLWSHIHAAPTKWEPPAWAKRHEKLAGYVLQIAFISYFALQIWRSRGVVKIEDLLPILFFGLFVGIVLLAMRFVKWGPARDSSQKETYQNAVITDQRIILYNHDQARPIIIGKTDIDKAELDYQCGARVLKIFRRSADYPAILIGAGEFSEARSLIKKRLLTS